MKESSSKWLQQVTNLVALIAIVLSTAAVGMYLYRWTTKAKREPIFADYPEGSFGDTGIVEPKMGIAAKAVAIQPDHKIIVAGFASGANFFDFVVIRLNSDGTMDDSFGTNGAVVTDFGGDEQASSVLVQPDGKILVGGTISPEHGVPKFAVARYLPNGQLDTAFGEQGLATTAIGKLAGGAQAMLLQSDGKIILAGHSTQEKNRDFALARYLTNGQLDLEFGSQGMVVTPFGAGHDEAFAAALQPDGKIVLAGYSAQGNHFDFTVARYLASGKLDSDFGVDGKASVNLGSGSNYAFAVAVCADGILVAGGAGSRANYDFAMVKFRPDGKGLVTNFGIAGKVITPFAAGDDSIYALTIQPNGKIIAVGSSAAGDNPNNIAIAKYLPTGTLDPDFGYGGKMLITNHSYIAFATALQPNGKIVTAGNRVDLKKGNVGMFVSRHIFDGTLDKR